MSYRSTPKKTASHSPAPSSSYWSPALSWPSFSLEASSSSSSSRWNRRRRRRTKTLRSLSRTSQWRHLRCSQTLAMIRSVPQRWSRWSGCRCQRSSPSSPGSSATARSWWNLREHRQRRCRELKPRGHPCERPFRQSTSVEATPNPRAEKTSARTSATTRRMPKWQASSPNAPNFELTLAFNVSNHFCFCSVFKLQVTWLLTARLKYHC